MPRRPLRELRPDLFENERITDDEGDDEGKIIREYLHWDQRHMIADGFQLHIGFVSLQFRIISEHFRQF